MKVIRQVRLSIAALVALRLRSGLALGAVGVGVAAVLLTSAVGTGARREIAGRIASMGTNLLIVRPTQVARLVARPTVRGVVTTLVPDDADAVRHSTYVLDVAPAAEFAAKVRAGGVSAVATVRGTTSSYAAVRRLRTETGRFLTDEDDRGALRVAVLGARIARALFPRGIAPLDDAPTVMIRSVPFDVVGVLPPRGVLADGSDEDNQVFVPLRTAMRRLLNRTWLNGLFVAVTSEAEMASAADAVRQALRQRHRAQAVAISTAPASASTSGDDFEVQDTTRYLDMQRRTTESVEQLALGLGAVALTMGGVGILALTLLSVRERRPEIGLRMAVGATRQNVFAQFMLEAILLALGGWALGAVTAAIASTAVATTTAWPLALPREAVAGSLAMAVLTGVGSGALPAWRASRTPPIEALLSK
jgi:putative ABC transport system permease protein